MSNKGNKGITDMLNMPHLDEVLAENGVDYKENALPEELPEPEQAVATTGDPGALMAALDQSLKTLEGSDHAKAMDDIYRETLEHSRTLMDLGFNVDERSRRGIFEIATAMYKNALDAKNSKRDAQLKLMKLMLDQRKQEFDEKKWKAERGESVTLPGDDPVATAQVREREEDRNELIKQMRAELKKTEAPKT